MTQLLPCPESGCRGVARLCDWLPHRCRVHCKCCGATATVEWLPKEQAITAWNIRSGNTQHTTQQETEG